MKNMKKILLVVVMALGMMMPIVGLLSQNVIAVSSICEDNTIDEDLKEAAGCKTSATITTTAVGIIDAVVAVIGIVTVGVMVYGGFMYVTSQGDSAKVRKGQQILIYGAVGLVVCILAFAIVNFVGGAFVNEN